VDALVLKPADVRSSFTTPPFVAVGKITSGGLRA
jgi:hypothetical protein